MGPPHLPGTVLSTPWMLGLIEQTCHDAVVTSLGPHRTVVGTGVELEHLAPAREGSTVQVSVEVVEAGRRMVFEARVVTLPDDGIADDELIGTATMRMAVVDLRRFGR
jgi:predicted thioesterase